MNFTAKADPCLFAAFALLNAVGYNAETGWHFTELRKRVRLKLASRAEHWRTILGNAGMLERVFRAGGATLMDMVPLLSLEAGSPALRHELEYNTRWQNESKTSLAGIEHWLERFYSEENVGELWAENSAFYDKAVTLCEGLKPSVQNLLTKFRDLGDLASLHLVVKPNLLDAQGRGYSLSSGDTTWIFIGPVENTGEAELLVIHELLHRWVDVAAERVVLEQNVGDPMPRARAIFRIVAESYPELAIWVGETVVRAATAWLRPTQRDMGGQGGDELIDYYERLGFIGFKDAYKHFVSGSEQSLPEAVDKAVHLVYERLSAW